MTDKIFAVNFSEGICGLEIIFNSEKKVFVVGDCHEELAKKYKSVIKNATILSLNSNSFLNLTSVEYIKEMFDKYVEKDKRVVFLATLSRDQLTDFMTYGNDKSFEILDQYIVKIKNRPLGFTIMSSPTGGVEVVQVDSVYEEELKLGSKILAVNGKFVEGEDEVIKALLSCFLPLRLLLESANDENIFAPEEKDDGEAPKWLALSKNTGDMVELSIHWFDESLGKKDFILLIRADATVTEIRAKIAVTSQLKFNAVKLIAKGVELKDDGIKLCDLKFKETEKVTVVVSETTQNRPKEKTPLDFSVEMKIIGAFLKTCNKNLIDYLWNDIDHDQRGILHITELDRLLTRFMGIYERANFVYHPMEYKHGSIQFNITEKLGLVIEGNEVIMCHSDSQADKAGMLPGWKVVGAEYIDKNVDGRVVKFPVDHRSCLQSLKRAKVECSPDGFHILCLIPVGRKYETIEVMKKQAIVEMKIDVPRNNMLTRSQYDQLPELFAGKAVRLEFKEDLEPSSFCAGDGKGALISKETANEQLKSHVDARVLSINATTVAHMPFGDIMEVLLAQKSPHILTLDN